MTASLLTFPLRKTRAATRKLALTEQRVADLKPHGSTFYVNDARRPGLSVRITKAGVKSYVFTKKINGKLLRITLGKAAGMTLGAARKAAEAYNGELAKGVDVAAARRANKALASENATTLVDAYERFLTLKDRRPSTTRDYNMVWRLYVPDSMKRKQVTEITSADVEKLKTVIGRTAKRTANKVVVLLSAIFSKSGRWADNPARGVERFEERVRTQRLTDDELARLWKALEADDGGLWSDFFKILILTGARRGALCTMRWQDLELSSGVWVVPANWSKNRRELAVPLTRVAVAVLERRRTVRVQIAMGLAVDKPPNSGHVVNPDKPWRKYLKLGRYWGQVTLHDVRRTLGSNLAKSGAAAATISKALGHISSQSARAYVHLDVEMAKAAIEKALGDVHAS